MKKELSQIKGFLLAIILVSAIGGGTYAFLPVIKGNYTYEINTFSSYDELLDFFQNAQSNISENYWRYDSPQIMVSKSNTAESLDGSSVGSTEYSTTNIQVEGVDEPDIVKTDGTYLYLLAESTLYIIKAYPADEAEVLASIQISGDGYWSNFFLNEDRLIIFTTSYRYLEDAEEIGGYYWNGISTTIITIYDISERDDPEQVKEIKVDGDYFNARMIDDYVYVITTEYTYQLYRTENGNETLVIPEITIDDETQKIPADSIYYVDIPERVDTMTHVLAIDIFAETVEEKSFLLGSAQTMYVSNDNIYLAYSSYNNYYPLIGEYYSQNEETTILHKIYIHNGDISYVAQGEVSGHVLNQFSMDAHDGFFRIATTTGNVWDQQQKSSNNIYVLDDELNQVGEIENIAPGERIYSARFMGAKAYLVTFKKVDPFFTIDLSDPYDPEVLGKLKIPGYSDYLHPFDENHIIGVGKDTVEALDSEIDMRGLDFAWYQGLKIALFDVSDFENPKEVAKVIIGDRGTDSPSLYDHKAFLFDRSRELLILPVSLCIIRDELKVDNNGYTGNIYGEFTFQGAYVYRLSLGDGFELQGRVTHLSDEDILQSGSWGYWGPSTITRILYINNVLYTISNNMVKMTNLNTMEELNSVILT
jgi:uncharacterized secreted protein with C-terminal beta-propeller domain